jgi:hypothetical protein
MSLVEIVPGSSHVLRNSLRNSMLFISITTTTAISMGTARILMEETRGWINEGWYLVSTAEMRSNPGLLSSEDDGDRLPDSMGAACDAG